MTRMTQMQMGRVALSVADLARSIDFYMQVPGLQVRERAGETAVLGARERDLLVLHAQPGARRARGVTGLYHFALLVPSRRELARTLRHLAATGYPLTGFADHAVSEAIYLSDPDGHGIEIYRDRPRAEWEYPNGRLKLTTDPLDLDSLLGELDGAEEAWRGLHPATRMGHVHLHVAHIPAAEQFYVDRLGFELMARYGSGASFVAAGGYHHHLGLNTWAGVGAPPPGPEMARLLWYEMQLPDEAALAGLVGRLRARGTAVAAAPHGYTLRDPAHNQILLSAAV
jgi:catechol 2,3-dioxygenase